jgi:hypothetical protein
MCQLTVWSHRSYCSCIYHRWAAIRIRTGARFNGFSTGHYKRAARGREAVTSSQRLGKLLRDVSTWSDGPCLPLPTVSMAVPVTGARMPLSYRSISCVLKGVWWQRSLLGFRERQHEVGG